MTGETEKGRSIRVISRFLPGKLNLAMAQAAVTPKKRLSGTRYGCGDEGQPDGTTGCPAP